MSTLTEREICVLKFVAKGLTNKEIGEELNISFHTVKTHLEDIYEKFGVVNRIQAVIEGIKKGIVELG